MQVMGLFNFKVALAFHIVGALCLFGAMAAEILCYLWLRRASSAEQVGLVSRTLKRLPLLFGLSGGTVLASGLYLLYVDWSHGEDGLGWIIVALTAFVLTAIIGASYGRHTSNQLTRQLADHVPLPALRAMANRSLFIWLTVNACIIIGILVVMIFQPNTLTAVLTIVVAVIVGLELRPRAAHNQAASAR